MVFSEDFVWKIISSRNFEQKMKRLEQLVRKFEEHNIGVVPAFSEEETEAAEAPPDKLPKEVSKRMEDAMFL